MMGTNKNVFFTVGHVWSKDGQVLNLEVTNNKGDCFTRFHMTIRIAEDHVIVFVGLNILTAIGRPKCANLGGHRHWQLDVRAICDHIRFDPVIKKRQRLVCIQNPKAEVHHVVRRGKAKTQHFDAPIVSK